MAAFCVETNDKTHVFAAEQSVAMDWMETMCDIAFQVLSIFNLLCVSQCDQCLQNVNKVTEVWVDVSVFKLPFPVN